MTKENLPKVGASVTSDGVAYRVWAPEKERVDAVLFDENQIARVLPLTAAGDGYFTGLDADGEAGDLYKYRLDGDEAKTFPDPASRFQPQGVHGPSMVAASNTYEWQHDAKWCDFSLADLVIYELHIGTFSPEGTYLGAIEKLDHLVELGVTAIEIMPLADFPGRWNWGYDGVMLYAPSRAYGTPDELRALVDAAHGRGLSVILDAVYNHLGPDGNYFGAYTKDYFNPAHKTPWGDGLNFDGLHHGPVREFFLGNPVYWMDEFHFDGFRLDAVHAILDDTPRHILAEIAAAIHARGGFVFAEDDRNEAKLATPEAEGGTGLDGLWADDFHHIVRVALTGERESYLENFTGSAEELAETLANGWYYRGQPTIQLGEARGTPSEHLPAHAFCYCISNHDQVGNRAFGDRMSVGCSPEGYRAASALLCLAPYTPLIFQGQEWAASTPFMFFTDHNEELGKLITVGRRKEFKGFAAFSNEHLIAQIPDPQAESTFLNSRLNWDEVTQGGDGVPAREDGGKPLYQHAGMLELYKEGLRLRREEAALRSRARGNWQVATLAGDLNALIYTSAESAEICMVIFSLKGDASTILGPIESESPTGDRVSNFEWIFSSNETRFGGDGATEFNVDEQMVEFKQPGLIVLKATIAPPVEAEAIETPE